MRFTFNRRTLLPILLMGIGLLAACIFFVVQLDYLIHNDLYNYGLRFSEEWAVQAWTYKNLTLIFSGVAILVNLFGLLYIIITKPAAAPKLRQKIIKRPTDFTQKLSLALLGVGGAALVASISYDSSTAAFIGLGLIFWGAIFLYVRTGEHVKEILLDKTTISSIKALDQMIRELDFKGQAIYLPPKYLKDFESSRVFISKAKGTNVPNSEKFLAESANFFIDSPKGISLEPPGAEMARLLEQVLETSFTRTNMQYFEQNIPKAIIEDLEIAQNVEIERRGQILSIKLENSTYAPMCSETRKMTKINGSIGCPICSALACALAKTTGKPIVIKREQATTDDRTINTEYRILDEK